LGCLGPKDCYGRRYIPPALRLRLPARAEKRGEHRCRPRAVFIRDLDRRTNLANGAFVRHERAGMRLVTAASRWQSSVLRSTANASAPNLRFLVEDHVQQGAVDFNVTVVVNKTQFPKFVHEVAHARACRADHLRQSLLADFR